MRFEYCKRCYLDRPKGCISICRNQAALQGMVVQSYLFQGMLITSEVITLNEGLSLQSAVGLLAENHQHWHLCVCAYLEYETVSFFLEDRNYCSGFWILVPVFLKICIVFTRVQFLMIFPLTLLHCGNILLLFYGHELLLRKWGLELHRTLCHRTLNKSQHSGVFFISCSESSNSFSLVLD